MPLVFDDEVQTEQPGKLVFDEPTKQKDEFAERYKEQVGKSGIRKGGELVGGLVKYPFDLAGKTGAELVSLIKGEKIPGMKEDVSGKTIVSTPAEVARQLGMMVMKPVTKYGTEAAMKLEEQFKNPIQGAKEAAYDYTPLSSPERLKNLFFGGRVPDEGEIMRARAGDIAEQEAEKIAPAFSSALPATSEAGALAASFAPGVPGYISRVKAGGSVIPGSATAEKVLEKGMEGFRAMRASPEAKIKKYGEVHRQILQPKKGTIQKVEIESGKNLQDAYELAAREGLEYDVSPTNTIDTRRAIEQLKPSQDLLNQEINDIISSKTNKKFDLAEIRNEITKNLRSKYKNDTALLESVSEIESQFDAAIKNRGQMVNGQQLNEIKQGMWETSYDPLAPNRSKAERLIGGELKGIIEKEFPDVNISMLNQKLGEYNQLRTLLENAHGGIVDKGKIGRYVAQGAGALVGAAIPTLPLGQAITVPAGVMAGGKISDFLVSPSRRSSRIANKVEKLDLPGIEENIQRWRQSEFTPAEIEKMLSDIKNKEVQSELRRAYEAELQKKAEIAKDLSDYRKQEGKLKTERELVKGAVKGASREMTRQQKAYEKGLAKMETPDLLGEFWHSKRMQDVPKMQAAKRALQERLQIEADAEQVGFIQEALFGERNFWKRNP